MMAVNWIINGWRQQARTTRAIDKALIIARERGMQTYQVSRIGRSYWLLCSRGAGSAYDVASVIRRHYAKVQQGIYLGNWRQQLILVVWRADSLQHCLAWPLDTDGIAHLKLLLERVTRKSRRHSALFLSHAIPEELRDYCHDHLAQWQIHTCESELAELRPAKSSRMRDMAVPPPWQQRQRVLMIALLTLLTAAAAGWHWWPTEPTETNASTTVQQALPDPQGVAGEVLRELPQLFRGMDHLAGWQWRSAQLNGEQLRVELQASYGRPEELGLQLDPAWRVEPEQSKASATVAWMRVPFARQQSGFSIVDLDVSAWQQQLQQLFPDLELLSGRTFEDSFFRRQVFTLRLRETSFSELARIASLLTHPHLRVVKLNLQAHQTLRTELEVHLYAPRPQSTEGA